MTDVSKLVDLGGLNLYVNSIRTGITSPDQVGLFNATTIGNLLVNGAGGGTTGNNTFLGTNAGASVTGIANTLIGFDAGIGVTTGTWNTIVGALAGQNVGAGGFNVHIGEQAGASATGSNNVSVGPGAMSSFTGSNSVAIGADALKVSSENVHTAVGYQALQNYTAGTPFQNGCTAIGNSALNACTTGAGNTAIGHQAMLVTTTGYENCAVGDFAMGTSTTSQWCVAVGVQALQNLTFGSNNTAVGLSSMVNLTTGTDNTSLGFNAGNGPNNGLNQQTTGSFNTWIGDLTGSSTSTQLSQCTVIGANALGGRSNAVFLGRIGTDVVYSGITVLGPNAVAGGNSIIPYTVSTLPAASAALKGARAHVTDATAPTFLGTLTGGGTVVCPVFCNGTIWVSG